MKIATVFHKTGKIQYTSSSNHFLPNENIDALVDDMFQNYIKDKKNQYSEFNGIKYHYLYKKYDDLIFFLYQERFNCFPEDNIKLSYIDQIIEVLSERSSPISNLTSLDIKNILKDTLLNESLVIEVISFNKKLLNTFLDSIFGVETFFHLPISPIKVLKYTLIRNKGSEYFHKSSNYTKLNYFYYSTSVHKFILNPMVNSKHHVILLEEEDSYKKYFSLDPKNTRFYIPEVLKQSKNLKKCVILLNKPQSSNDVTTEDFGEELISNTKFALEKFSMSQNNTQFVLNLIEKHFSEYFER